jgi:hypothetical protein
MVHLNLAGCLLYCSKFSYTEIPDNLKCSNCPEFPDSSMFKLTRITRQFNVPRGTSYSNSPEFEGVRN